MVFNSENESQEFNRNLEYSCYILIGRMNDVMHLTHAIGSYMFQDP